MQILICQHFMLAVLCFAGWSVWFHLKFYPSVVHEKCDCTNCIKVRRVFQSWFVSGAVDHTWSTVRLSSGFVNLRVSWFTWTFCFPLLKMRRKQIYPSILWQNPRRISIIWTKNVPELCHCSGRAWRSFAPFPRPLLCFSNTASGGHM